MERQVAVFQGVGGVPVKLWVLSVDGDTLYVTDSVGLAECDSVGTTRRMLGMARSRAFRDDPALVLDGSEADWTLLKRF